MGQAVEESAGQPFGAEGFGPFVERQVAGDQRGAALIALRDQLEQELRTSAITKASKSCVKPDPLRAQGTVTCRVLPH